jgi:delta-aminolevulinic acid dehydratase/porphobilinogen synthase
MSKSFTQVTKPAALGLADIIPAGRLKGCVVEYVVPDEYEYLKWAHDTGFIRFSKDVLTKVRYARAAAERAEYYANEVAPWADYGDVPY